MCTYELFYIEHCFFLKPTRVYYLRLTNKNMSSDFHVRFKLITARIHFKPTRLIPIFKIKSILLYFLDISYQCFRYNNLLSSGMVQTKRNLKRT